MYIAGPMYVTVGADGGACSAGRYFRAASTGSLATIKGAKGPPKTIIIDTMKVCYEIENEQAMNECHVTNKSLLIITEDKQEIPITFQGGYK